MMTGFLFVIAATTMSAVAGVFPFSQGADEADLFVTAGGSGTACTVEAPCGSFDAAYRAARPGDVIEVAGGDYAGQSVPALGRAAPAIRLRAAEGATVTVAGLTVKADHVVISGVDSSRHVNVDSSVASDPVEHVRLENVRAATHWISNARDFTWHGGAIGPSFNTKASMIGGNPASHRLTYDGVLWHDATRDSQSVHMECFYVASVQGLTIRNSRFHNCAVFDVLITQLGNDPQPRDIVFENTVFEASRDIGSARAYYSFMVHDNVALDGFVLRNNVWALPFAVNGTVTNARAVGNIGVGDWNGGCRAGIRYAHNVFTRGKCGSTDKVAPQAFSQFVAPDKGDWRLRRGAAAVDAGHPTDFPSLDASGHARPHGRAPDAGAFEFGAGPPGQPVDTVGHEITPPPAPAAAPVKQRTAEPPPRRWRARVVRVVNGRKLRLRRRSGRRVTVRLRGIRAMHRRCGRRVAAAKLRKLARPRRRVTVTGGRRVAYVHRQRRDVGRRLIARGWARVWRSKRRLTRRDSYLAAQRRARRRDRGLWQGCR